MLMTDSGHNGERKANRRGAEHSPGGPGAATPADLWSLQSSTGHRGATARLPLTSGAVLTRGKHQTRNRRVWDPGRVCLSVGPLSRPAGSPALEESGHTPSEAPAATPQRSTTAGQHNILFKCPQYLYARKPWVTLLGSPPRRTNTGAARGPEPLQRTTGDHGGTTQGPRGTPDVWKAEESYK
ncbi:hypothetical protein E2C01_056207 [Portunus trituberculatus]|uniref:Uncharacterized protein n=1 Tax=Portunus trituberculatus TaxID=210409 RepID=A0A5B7GZV7_PORTR|nr:hypothetical protein [Portunus trituberculatus]